MASLARKERATYLVLARYPDMARCGQQEDRQLRRRDPALGRREDRDQASGASESVMLTFTHCCAFIY